ncbi:MAG: hypothetical protein H6537_02930 [Bacteroidales bacterium]|nr:hypothetical protein [Bacteroidales bacterium]HPD95751.1 hypothetical protein [Tenuifilaceae bacterium]HRX32234.1 hypothetical protein [Tenuifilaceae bacterium]
MKSNYTKFFLLALLAVFTLGSCSDDDDNGSSKLIVTLGAQSNTSIGSFYSISENKVYTQETAYNNQENIDLLCFYEFDDTHQNYTTIASPGSKITGIFTDETAPDNWTTKNLTTFCQVSAESLTVDQFDQIKQDDAVIETYYDSVSFYKKAKVLKVDDIYAFKTQDGTYGLFKVLAVSDPEGETGWIKIELKLKKITQ